MSLININYTGWKFLFFNKILEKIFRHYFSFLTIGLSHFRCNTKKTVKYLTSISPIVFCNQMIQIAFDFSVRVFCPLRREIRRVTESSSDSITHKTFPILSRIFTFILFSKQVNLSHHRKHTNTVIVFLI